MGSEKFCLRWNDFETNISSAFRELRDDKDFFDVTLACDDEQIQAHKVILSACSPFFRNVLRRNPHQHPLLYLKGVKYTDLQSVLNFMYHGEVNVAQEELNSFLAVAEDLRVKGLTQGSNNSAGNSKPKETYRPPPTKSPAAPTRPPDRDPLPPPKRPRPVQTYQQEDDDIQEVVPVKSEPRDHVIPPAPAPAPASAPVYSSPAPVYSSPAPLPPAPVQEEHHGGQLQQIDDSMYAADDSYEDYGGYENNQGYETGGAMAEQTMDASKGFVPSDFIGIDPSYFKGMTLEEASEKALQRLGPGTFICLVCGKYSPSFTNAKHHFEAMHFAGSGYNCEFCFKFMKTKHALDCHISRNHRSDRVARTQGELFTF